MRRVRVGMVLSDSNGALIKIASVTWIDGVKTVYNFAVDRTHTYFVHVNGRGIWVHNKPLLGGLKPNLGFGKMPEKSPLSAVKNAVREAQAEVGHIGGSGKTTGKFGSAERREGKNGYWLDPPHDINSGDPEAEWHVNWCDWTGGKRGRGGRQGVIPILRW